MGHGAQRAERVHLNSVLSVLIPFGVVSMEFQYTALLAIVILGLGFLVEKLARKHCQIRAIAFNLFCSFPSRR